LVIFIDGKVERLLDAVAGVIDPLLHAIRVNIENFVGRQEVRVPQRIIQSAAVAFEHLDVASQKIDLVGIEQLEVAVENLAGEFVIQAGAFVVVIGQEAGSDVTGITLLHIRFEFQRVARIHGSKNRGYRQRQNRNNRNTSHVTNSPDITRKLPLSSPLLTKGLIFMPVSDQIYNKEVQKYGF
jgi:hypothetical protein